MFKLLVGIGNPGKKYNNTRHNVGWEVLDSFNLTNKSELISKKDDYELYKTFYESKELYSLKPMTYVNNSGIPLKKIIKKLNINTNDILIIVDDINLMLGVIRLKERGGPGGHNGLKSVFSEILSNDIPRLRLGIGTSERYGEDLVSFVLGKFETNETKIVKDMIDRSVEAIDNILSVGFAKAMELTNYKKQDKVN